MKIRMLAIFGVASVVQAQPRAVIAKSEPHHHLVFEDATIRVLRVRVPAHDSTLLHQHDPDYFWIALGPSTIINAKPGERDATVASQDLSIHYTPGQFAHVARNPGDAPFDNITVELLKPQSGLESLCTLVRGDVINCDTSTRAAKFFVGANELPSFRTNGLRVSLLTIEPGQSLTPTDSTRTTWVIALDTLDAKSSNALTVDRGGRWVGGTFHSSSSGWSLTNHTTHAVRALAVVERTRD